MKTFPLPTEYIVSIKLFEENCSTLTELTPVLIDNGEPELYFEDYGMVFKMRNHNDGKFYALICFTKNSDLELYTLCINSHSEKIPNELQYLENELFVDSKGSKNTEFPVVVCPWDARLILDNYLKQNHSETTNDSEVSKMNNRIMIEHEFKDELEKLVFEAEKGDAGRQVELARKFYAKAMYIDAYKWYEKAAQQNNGDGYNGLGCCYLLGHYVDKDLTKAFELFSKASELGSINGTFNLARAYYHAWGTPYDHEKAGRLFEITAEHGIPESQYMVAKSYMYNHLGTISWRIVQKRNTEIAYEWFLKAANQDHSKSQYEIGLFYQSGTDPCVRNLAKAHEWFKKSADKGNRNALFALGNLYYNGLDEKTPDYKTAFDYYYKAAEKGHVESMYKVAIALYYGKEIEKDQEQGISWLRKVVAQDVNHNEAYALLYQIEHPEEIENPDFPTEATNNDICNAQMDPHGVMYSKDGRKLIKFGIDDNSEVDGFGNIRQQTLRYYVVADGVEIICDSAFEYCESLEHIILPTSVKKIGRGAFYGCENLHTIEMHEGIYEFGSFAFYKCSSLRDLLIPASIETVGIGAFTGVQSIISNNPKFKVKDGCLYSDDNKTLLYFFNDGRTYYNIPYGTNIIGESAFSGSSIEYVTLPNTLTRIENDAFSNTNLEEIRFPLSLKYIGSSAFYNCRGLVAVTFPQDVEEIGVQAFESCMNLTYLELSDNIKIINNCAFASTNISSVKLPKKLESLGIMVFVCTPLKHITGCDKFIVDEGVIYTFDKKTLVQYYGQHSQFIIPEYVENIADYAFACAYCIKEVVFPSTIKSIGKNIFEQTLPKVFKVAPNVKEQLENSIEPHQRGHIVIFDK